MTTSDPRFPCTMDKSCAQWLCTGSCVGDGDGTPPTPHTCTPEKHTHTHVHEKKLERKGGKINGGKEDGVRKDEWKAGKLNTRAGRRGIIQIIILNVSSNKSENEKTYVKIKTNFTKLKEDLR